MATIHRHRRKQHVAGPDVPTIAKKLRAIRLAAGLTQEAIGAQGFVSTPGWIKLEHDQRSPSENLLEKLCDFLVAEKVIQATEKQTLHHELCALKYCGDRREFVRQLAKDYLRELSPVVIQATP